MSGGPFDVAECQVCGEEVMRLLADLHIEDHVQRGEYPTPPADPGGQA